MPKEPATLNPDSIRDAFLSNLAIIPLTRGYCSWRANRTLPNLNLTLDSRPDDFFMSIFRENQSWVGDPSSDLGVTGLFFLTSTNFAISYHFPDEATNHPNNSILRVIANVHNGINDNPNLPRRLLRYLTLTSSYAAPYTIPSLLHATIEALRTGSSEPLTWVPGILGILSIFSLLTTAVVINAVARYNEIFPPKPISDSLPPQSSAESRKTHLHPPQLTDTISPPRITSGITDQPNNRGLLGSNNGQRALPSPRKDK